MLLLSDFNREVGPQYPGLFTTGSGFKDVARRAVFVIGQDGTVTYRWDNPEPPGLPEVEPVLDAVRQVAGKG